MHQRHPKSPPPELHAWLMDNGSLTAHLQQACGGRFHVRLLWQGWQRPLRHEAEMLHMPLRGRAWLREVLLYCDEHPLVYARTLIPYASLRGRQRRLRHLGRKPLGAWLFSHPHLQRSPLRIEQYTAENRLYRHIAGYAPEMPPTLWGRSSVFYPDRKPLLVSEYFLPHLPPFPHAL